MSIKLNSGFEILRFSDLTYEKMTVEIQYQGEQIAQINKDRGLDKIEIEIFTEYMQSNFLPKFNLVDLIQALNEAKKLLENC